MKREYIDSFWYWVKLILLAGAIVFIIKGFLFIPMSVQGISMENTLKQGDQIVYEKFSKINRFDVIIFTLPDGTTYIKRVIGLPGEHIEYIEDELYVNGEKIKEDFLGAVKKKRNRNQYTRNFNASDIIGEDEIPEKSYFVLGDNRQFSKDSRAFGEVQEKSLVGKAKLIYYPFNRFKLIK